MGGEEHQCLLSLRHVIVITIIDTFAYFFFQCHAAGERLNDSHYEMWVRLCPIASLFLRDVLDGVCQEVCANIKKANSLELGSNRF